jgi:crotonobetainyl-CoA:carnitine CoA-transferase CaiB-like acyl-CoA transferase
MSRACGGEPRYVPLTLADRTVGLMASNAILAAVIARHQTGVGQAVEVPMFETMAQYVLGEHMAGATFEPPMGVTGYPRLLVQERRPYPTSDGHLCVLIYTDRHW